MSLIPGYGQTPLPHDELAALLPEVVVVLGEPITRAAVYDLEQRLQDRVTDELMPAAIDGSLPLNCVMRSAPLPTAGTTPMTGHLDKTCYIELLRAYDQNRDVADLAAFVSVDRIE